MAASVTTVLLNSFGGKLLPAMKTKTVEERQKITLKVPNMHCEGCASTIRDTLEKIIRDVEVKTDLDKHLVEVTFYHKDITEEGVEEILTNLGFKPSK